jgi:dienelactone hydrolase
MQIFARTASGPALTSTAVQIGSGGIQTSGFLARPLSDTKVPAVLLVVGEQGITGATRQAASEIAATGYAVLAIDYDPEHVSAASSLVQTVAQEQLSGRLNAAVAWLSAQPFIDAGRLGAIGWAEGGEWVMRLAESGKIQAGVVAGGAICSNPDLLLRVRAVPVLAIVSGDNCTAAQAAAVRQRVVAANLQHMIVRYKGSGQPLAISSGPQSSNNAATSHSATNDAADQAWVTTYEFLAKHVEDAGQSPVEAASEPQVGIARIVDIMRAVNSDDGVRGQLARSLATAPKTAEQWNHARSLAAVVAESGNLLLARRPPKGSLTGWRQRATDFRAEAEVLLHAIERHDFRATQDALRKLPQSCAACHADYR